jgi:hypothetical protein
MIGLLLLAALQAVGPPVVDEVEPDVLEPYRPARLSVRGTGFDDGCRVLLGVPGRMVPVKSELTGSEEIRVELTAGYGPHPAERQLEVDCGHGRRSAPIRIRIGAEQAPVPEEVPPDDADQGDEIFETSAGEPPRVAGLDPATVAVGQPLTLTVTGEGFRDGAQVEVFANAHAGSSVPPVYRMVAFEAEFASDTVLLVDFDRGFAPSPRLRQVVVVNPDGTASAPLYLEIQRRQP